MGRHIQTSKYTHTHTTHTHKPTAHASPALGIEGERLGRAPERQSAMPRCLVDPGMANIAEVGYVGRASSSSVGLEGFSSPYYSGASHVHCNRLSLVHLQTRWMPQSDNECAGLSRARETFHHVSTRPFSPFVVCCDDHNRFPDFNGAPNPLRSSRVSTRIAPSAKEEKQF